MLQPDPLPPLSIAIRAQLFTQLAALEQAGLPPDKQLALLRLPGKSQHRLDRWRARFAAGADFNAAAMRCGVFTSIETCLLQATANTGNPVFTLRRLAAHYTQQAARGKQMRARLLLPAMLLLAALAIQPLPALFSGSLNVGGYLARLLLPLALLLVGREWLRRRAQVLQPNSKSEMAAALLRLPLLGPLLIRHDCRDFFESLGLLLEAGVPLLDALPHALRCVRQAPIKQELATLRGAIEHGATLAQALAPIDCLCASSLHELVTAGEASGALPAMLLRYAAAETTAIEHIHQQLADWLPRVVYALIAVCIAYGILQGGLPLPA